MGEDAYNPITEHYEYVANKWNKYSFGILIIHLCILYR